MSERRFSFSGASASGILPSPGGDGALRVVLAGPDMLALAGLAGLLADEADLAIVDQVVPREAGSGAVARSIRLHHPDLVIWDLGAAHRMPDALAELGTGELPVLALVASEDVAQAALASGVRGTALRTASPERIAVAVRAMTQGLIVVDEGLSDAVFGRLRAPVGGLPVDPLTAREQEVVQLIAQGLSNKAIGERLGISEHTAKFHVNAILSKLGAQTRTDAVVRAARLGLILL